MNALHVHGQATPTSRVVRNTRGLTSPLKKRAIVSSPRPRRPIAATQTDSPDNAQITGHALPVLADFRGLDILSAMDYLKRLAVDVPPRLGRDKTTQLLLRRAQLPKLVLSHQLASLFSAMRDLEKEINFLVSEARIVAVPLQDGTMAYIKREDYPCPSDLLKSPIDALSDAQVREYAEQGWLIRRNGSVVVSVPNIGTFFSALRAARKFVTMQLRKSVVLEKDIKARYEVWKDGGLFTFENLMHDLVGSSRVEILMLTVGRAVRLTKRGREGG